MSTLSTKTDQELVKEVLSGKTNVYGQIVDRYQAALVRYANYLIGGHHEMAKDAVQSAFIKAYKYLNSYDDQQKFSSWIYRIVHNEAISLLRKEKKHLQTDWDFLAELPNEKDVDLTEKLVNDEQLEKLHEALQKLTFKQRQTLLLYYLEDKSYLEIAEIMHTSKNNVGSDLNRAKKKLFKLMRIEE